jgi:hypothetical protein
MIDLLEQPTADETSDPSEMNWYAEAETQSNVVRFTRAMWIALTLLALFNSSQLLNVVNGLGVGVVPDTIVAVSTTWNEQMEKNGLDQPVAQMRDAMQRLHDLSWREIQVITGTDKGVSSMRGSENSDKAG